MSATEKPLNALLSLSMMLPLAREWCPRLDHRAAANSSLAAARRGSGLEPDQADRRPDDGQQAHPGVSDHRRPDRAALLGLGPVGAGQQPGQRGQHQHAVQGDAVGRLQRTTDDVRRPLITPISTAPPPASTRAITLSAGVLRLKW